MTSAQDTDLVAVPRAAVRETVAREQTVDLFQPQPGGISPATAEFDSIWLALATSLAAVGIVGKWILLPFPVSTVGEFVRWVLRLAVISAPDMCFACGLAVVCWFVAYTLRWWPSLVGRTWRRCSMGLFAVCAVYAVASVPMFKVTKVPFTVRLLSFVGGPEVMLSSAGEYFPAGIVALLIACPVAVLMAPWALRQRSARRVLAPVGWRVMVVALAGVVAGGMACQRYVKAEWTDPNRWERRIARSPHWVLVASCVEELSKDRPFTHTYSFDEIDDSDFRKPIGAASLPENSLPSQPLVPAEQRPKNVILIVLESTGVDYFGTHGSRFPTTPNVDRLAKEKGVVFENVYAQAASSCKSLVALTNSVYPRPDWLLIVRDNPQFDVISLPQVLKEHGYRTCYAHSGYWGWQKRDRFLKARGADAVLDASTHPEHQISSWGIDDRAMYQDVLDWIDAEPSKPFFAFAYTIETHHPYYPPSDGLYDFGVEDEEQARYLNALRAADAKIAWLIAELEKRGLAESTLIAITADHGESFGEHNQRTHSFGIYEQTVHVPLVLLHASLKDMPRRDDNVGRHIDIAPTLLDLLNVPAPAVWQGRSLFRERDRRAYFLSVGNEVVLGLRDGRYKYHYYVDTSLEELFDLQTDRAESQNLATAEPERARQYRRRLGGWVTYQREFLAKHGVR
ncbi:MAG TPA: sulfatase-like hydrolase/transferase [Pirellulales bacterium]|nr:sulfatase-like hydrolase/transferase [Pirellulales bacterium]